MNSSSVFNHGSFRVRFSLKALTMAILLFLPLLIVNSQPVWVSTTPSLGAPGPATIPINYGIDRAGTVYIMVLNYNNPNQQAPTTVRAQAISPTLAAVVYNAVIPVSGGDINTVLQSVAASLASSTYHTIYLVAADASNVLQATSVRLNATTLPCPKIQLFNFFGNQGECVNLGARGMWQVSQLGVLPTGILAGSQWTIDWGDGSAIWTYTSTADDDLPPAQYHDFSTTTNCAYVGTWTVKNPCNEFYAQQGVFVIHGRDIPDDGDGRLEMQETISGDVDIVYVCEGSEHNLVLRDISVWNCQNPTVPPPLNPADYDNESPRTIQFVYGETPAGTVMNTITGDVLIDGSHVANGSDGYVGPVIGPLYPPNPNTLTDVITIPATCKAGERFYVYLKDWNKCNPFVDESLNYVSNYFIIEVIDAPPPPIVVTPQVYCYGDVPANLTATANLPGNTLNWYDDANLTTLLHTGSSFAHGQTAPGEYDFYVTETSGVNGCEGPPAKIDLTIREAIERPGSISGPSEVCINATGQVFSVTNDPPTYTYGGTTEYVWTVPAGWTITSGQGTRQITVDIGGSAGTRTVSVVTRYTSDPRCPSQSRSRSVTVSPLSVGGTISGTTPICLNSSVTLRLTGRTGTIQRWERRLLPATAWTNVNNTNSTYSYTPPAAGTWEFRVLVRSGSCSETYSSVYQLVVDPHSVGGTTSGGNSPICINSSTGNITLSGYTGTILRWQYRRNGGSWNNISNETATLNHTPAGSGTYEYRAVVRSGSCDEDYSSITTIIVNPESVGGSVTGGTTPICLGSSTGDMTLSGHVGTVVKWQRRLGSGAWSDIANTTTTHNDTPPSAGTWYYRAQVQSGVCSPVYSGTRSVTVVTPSVGGTITGGTTPLCPGVTTGTMTVSGPTGAVMRWEKRVDGGEWSTISNTTTQYSEIPSSSGTWEYRAFVQNAPCPGEYSSVRTIVVRPQYTAQLHDDISICNNTSTNFNVVLSGGTPPYIINYTRNGTPQSQITGYTSGANISTGLLSTGSYVYILTSVVDADGCNAQSLGTSITITVGAALTSATISGSGDGCVGSSSWFSLIVNGGAPPFRVTYTLDGGPNTLYSDYNNGDQINLGTLAVGNHTVHIVSIQDACNDYVPSLPGNYLFSINAIPDASATVNNTATICSGGATDIVLRSTVPSTNFAWTVSNTPAVTWTSAPADGSRVNGNNTSIAQTLAHTASSPTTVTYAIIPTGPAPTNCPGSEITRTVVVNPSAQVNDPANQVHCAGTAVPALVFTTNRTGGTTTYAWSNDNTAIGLGASGTGNLPAFTATNSGTAPITATITVTPTFTNGGQSCPGTPQTFTITVNPSGQVNKPADQVHCNNASVPELTFTTNRSGGTTTYAWTNSNTAIGLGASGTGNLPSFTATNSGTAPISATITVTPTFTNGGQSCSGPSQTFTITVNPSGQVNKPADQVHCTGTDLSALTFTTNRSGGTTTYAWTNSNTAIGLGASGTGNLPGFTATNSGTAPISATITVTPTFTNGGQSCSGPSQTFTITVNPTALVNKPADQVRCNNASVPALVFTTNRSGGTTTYAWSNDNTAIGLGASGTGNLPSFIATNSGTAPISATITVTPTFTNGGQSCSGPSQTFTITVNPTPALSSTLTPADRCSNTTFAYTPTSLTAGTAFSWERLDAPGITTTAPATGTDGISHVLRNLTSATIPVTYRYTLTANGCSNVQDVVVNIKPEPVISDQAAGVCSGESLNHHILLENFTNPGDNVTFTWPAPVLSGGLTGGTARTSPSSANMTDSFVNTSGLAETATYTVTPVYQGCTGEAKTIVVTVGSQPVLADLDKFACSAVPTELVLAVAAGSSPATTYDIQSITAQAGLVADAGNAIAADGITDVNYLANDRFTNETGQNRTVTYRVRPVFGATCIGDWVNVVVTIRPQPVIVPNQRQTVCSNVASSLEIRLLPANTPAGSTFSWSLPVMSDGSVQGTAGTGVAADPAGTLHITDTFENYGTDPITATYSVTPYSSFGCAGTPVDVVITINPEPVAPVITGDTILCTNQTSVIYSVPATAGSSYAWTVPASVGNIVIDANSAIIITAAAVAGSGTITVIETNSYGCAGIAGSFDVDVMAPSPQSDITGSDIVCALETGVYSVPDHPGSVYTWTLPAGAALIGNPSAASITVTFGTVSGNISVREVNAAGCVTNHNPLAVTVRALPTAVISNSGTVCVEDTHPVNIALTGAAPWRVVYAINGVDQPEITGITASPYTLNAAAAGNYTITSVTDNNGCTNTGVGNATVSYWPVPSATLSGTTAVCAGQSATLTISLAGAAPYTFVYTDGTTPVTVSGHPTNTYTFTVTPVAEVTYTLVSMEDNHGCDGTLLGSATVTIHAQPVLSFAVTNLQCNGDNSGAIDLTVTGSATNSFAWLGPDGFTAGTEDITGIRAGLYNVTVTSSDGCVASGQVTVYQPDVLTLSSTGNMVLLCNGDPTGAGSFTAAGGTTPYTFSTLVNTAGATLTPSATSVDVTGAGGGTITVRVTDAHDCTAEATIIVTEPPALNLTATTTNISCFGGNNGTIITSVTGGTAPYIYAWTASAGGSGIVAGAPNQGSLTAGTYEVTVTDANGCQLVRSWTLTQPTELSVNATTDDDLIGTCSSAQLSATVTGGVEPAGGYLYSWSPAAGLTSTTIANPVASPASTTTYTVTVTDDNGCTKTASVTVSVAPVLTAVAFADDNLIGDCPGSETQLHVNVNGGEAPYSFSWLPVTDLSDPAVREPMASPAANT
ncbi:MAG: hypothetical protein QM238_06825, partial [Bacteroidota bacterium]|nr:hypothetical protein [Bacteroidota bacterium]